MCRSLLWNIIYKTIHWWSTQASVWSPVSSLAVSAAVVHNHTTRAGTKPTLECLVATCAHVPAHRCGIHLQSITMTVSSAQCSIPPLYNHIHHDREARWCTIILRVKQPLSHLQLCLMGPPFKSTPPPPVMVVISWHGIMPIARVYLTDALHDAYDLNVWCVCYLWYTKCTVTQKRTTTFMWVSSCMNCNTLSQRSPRESCTTPCSSLQALQLSWSASNKNVVTKTWSGTGMQIAASFDRGMVNECNYILLAVVFPVGFQV